MSLFELVLVVDAVVLLGLIAAYVKFRDSGFEAIIGFLLAGVAALALAQFAGLPVVGWIACGIWLLGWALFLLKVHRPVLRAVSGGRVAAEKRFFAIAAP